MLHNLYGLSLAGFESATKRGRPNYLSQLGSAGSDHIYLHVVLDEELGRAQDVHKVRPDQLEGGFALERRVRIVEAHVQRVSLWRVGVILLPGRRGMATAGGGRCGCDRSESTLVEPSTGQELA